MENVTSIEQLLEYKKGQLVELPPFAEGQPFYARLKRPSMLGMIKNNKIPNSLLTKANELFLQDSAGFDPEEENMLGEMVGVLDIVASETFVEPTWKQLQEAGIELTDDQLMYLFSYTQQGVKALESFRTE